MDWFGIEPTPEAWHGLQKNYPEGRAVVCFSRAARLLTIGHS